ncbi:MAG: carboxypeptidase regulatory-like domain-containing protein [Acidobacteria bacterium]|nr:carboxypeptidase regulatory-like domain-containing protein [Acidobacteriota bacterium]
MFRYACIVNSFAFVLHFSVLAIAQTGGIDPRNGSISGRVTISGKPVVNKKVNAVGGKQEGSTSGLIDGRPDQQETFSALTDGDGRYRITGLPAGTFTVEAQMAAYVDEKKPGSRSITLDRSEQVEKNDISLVRGGVITGRITDSTGNPLIAKKVRLQRAQDGTAGDQNATINGFGLNPDIAETDDRGIYRAFGLPAGKYIVSAGSGIFGDGSNKYPLTYHLDETDEKQATRIEVKEGSEVTGIDIRIGSEKGTYEALGRVIDAETGVPVPRASLVCSRIEESGESPVHSSANSNSDEQGNFRFTGLLTGKYSISITPDFLGPKQGEYFTEEATFRIADTNVSGVEVRARRGGAISGVVVLENNRDPAQRDRLTQLILTAVVIKREDPQPSFGMSGQGMARINSDGSFRVVGVAPGEVQFGIFSLTGRIPEIVRIEKDGSQIAGNLELKRGEVITGMRLILAFGTGVIRGQVEIDGGFSAEGSTLHVIAQRIGAVVGSDDNVKQAAVDKKGRFVLDELLDGEYELILRVSGENPPSPVSQRVRVVGGAEVPVTLRLAPNRKDQEK